MALVSTAVLPSVKEQDFWGFLDPQVERVLLETENRVRQAYGSVPSHIDPKYDVRLRKSYQRWLKDVAKQVENPVVETKPAETLTLGTGGLFRNMLQQTKIAHIPAFQMPVVGWSRWWNRVR